MAFASPFAAGAGALVRTMLALIALALVACLALMWWWDYEPPHFDVAATVQARVAAKGGHLVTGAITTSALMTSAETLLDKRGGYLSNEEFDELVRPELMIGPK